MPRQRLSEFRAKQILYDGLGLPYLGWAIDAQQALGPQLAGVPKGRRRYVVKVDEGVKRRYKQGLVKLDVAASQLSGAIRALQGRGYRWLIIEPMVMHEGSEERYVSLMQDREGLWLAHSAHGGIEIESQTESLSRVLIQETTDWTQLEADTGLSTSLLQRLIELFRANFFTLLELNPYVLGERGPVFLDAAVEVDDAGVFFAPGWATDDMRWHEGAGLSAEEVLVRELDANSPASFNLTLLEPNGAVFLLLSGGGASVVVADEVYNRGYGKQLANYGEYSGNPTTEEAYLYTRAVLRLLLRSKARRKVLFIGGAVANFTDIAKTFAGVIQAISEVGRAMKAAKVGVYVRRGGPNQEAGLANLRETLVKFDLLGAVHDASVPLTDVVGAALEEVKRG